MQKKENNLYPHKNLVDRVMRSEVNAHQPAVLWFTGLSGSGKSTIANALEFELVTKYHVHTYLLDGDNIRTGLNAGLGFSDADRKENIRRIGEVCKLMFDAGLIVLTAFISPFRADRDSVRALLPEGGFCEIYISCPIEVCKERDPKGLYLKAQKGEIPEFTGINSPYEAPLHPELTIDSNELSVDGCVEKIVNFLREKNILTK